MFYLVQRAGFERVGRIALDGKSEVQGALERFAISNLKRSVPTQATTLLPTWFTTKVSGSMSVLAAAIGGSSLSDAHTGSPQLPWLSRMSQDGRPQQITRNIEGRARLNWQTCADGGEYAARPGSFGRCSRGHMHCGRCGSVARRFRKGYVCGNC